jgi:hypothetical protein
MTKHSPSMTLTLFHGRNTKDEDMDDWGFDGPLITGINSVSVTYKSHIRFFFNDPTYAELIATLNGWSYEGEVDSLGEVWVWLDDDLFPAGGKYYGDWSLTVLP